MSRSLLKDGRTVDDFIIVDFDATHTNCVTRLTAEEYAMFVQAAVPDPPSPPPAVPDISKAQALLYLLSLGKTEADVEAAISTIADSKQRAVAQIEWGYRQPFRADHPLFAALAPALGITDLAAAFQKAAML